MVIFINGVLNFKGQLKDFYGTKKKLVNMRTEVERKKGRRRRKQEGRKKKKKNKKEKKVKEE